MKLNFILIFLCLATLSISGCLSLNPGEYKRSINVRISWDELKIFNKNQTNLLMNISNYNFSKQIINQNKTSFKIQCSKKPEIDTTIYFELFEEKNSTIGNITYNGGGMIIKYSFPNDPCYYTHYFVTIPK
jgi:hypothetical protein